MPNLSAAKKAQRADKKKTAENRKVKAHFTRLTKKTLKLIEIGEIKLAQQQMPQTFKALDKAAKKGVIHPNKSARIKAKLAKKGGLSPEKSARTKATQTKKVKASDKNVKTAQKNP